jgi:hypothetical protein
MNDLLQTAARRLGVATETSAGPGSGPDAGPGKGLPVMQIWARWPRHPLEVAQEMLNRMTAAGEDAHVTPLGGTPLWRARRGTWTYIGRFEDAVAHLATQVAADRPGEGSAPPRQESPRATAAPGSGTAGKPLPRTALMPFP